MPWACSSSCLISCWCRPAWPHPRAAASYRDSSWAGGWMQAGAVLWQGHAMNYHLLHSCSGFDLTHSSSRGVMCARSGAVVLKWEHQAGWMRGEERDGSPCSLFPLQLMSPPPPSPAVLQQCLWGSFCMFTVRVWDSWSNLGILNCRGEKAGERKSCLFLCRWDFKLLAWHYAYSTRVKWFSLFHVLGPIFKPQWTKQKDTVGKKLCI